MTDWVSWQISEDRTELIGPCGCRLPNSFDGVMQARRHQCDSAISPASTEGGSDA